MQRETALAVGMSPELAVASNATNSVGMEGQFFLHFCIWHSVGMTLMLSLLTWLQAGVLQWMLP